MKEHVPVRCPMWNGSAITTSRASSMPATTVGGLASSRLAGDAVNDHGGDRSAEQTPTPPSSGTIHDPEGRRRRKR
ncbi:hypothetical protein OHA72_12065 [Dactylosporangium sp. NBC_01737]|uniref:hypothetical protein n=1 Tax=Dactylosporangium sp. NBC_01737 TaxID=2975959 RepID=UPI002E0DE1A1|nr:hypothetical protein OHA72_12065 [Dactylosporangium sp. NBC_01737]